MVDSTRPTLEDVLKAGEIRRPGLTAVFNSLRKKYPTWRADMLLAKAKTRWHAEREKGAR